MNLEMLFQVPGGHFPREHHDQPGFQHLLHSHPSLNESGPVVQGSRCAYVGEALCSAGLATDLSSSIAPAPR
jgi:hypothetical protein